jgi:dihydroxyacid dehydratase/phosphogluconate dehydratase
VLCCAVLCCVMLCCGRVRDEIVVNLPAKTIDINVTDDVMATRKAAWTPHQPT